MHVEPAVFCTALFADGLKESRAGKVSFEDDHRQGCPVSVRNEQTVLVIKKLIEENPHISICERCDVSIGTAERVVHGDLNLKKKKSRQGGYPMS